MAKKNTYVIANWKMNPETLKEAKELFASVKKKTVKCSRTAVVVCPPSLFVSALASKSMAVLLGVQNIYFESKGSFTGEISAPMAKSMGVSHVILGHSERRAMGETDAMVNKKVHAALAGKLVPVVCIGEEARDRNGEYLAVIKQQITEVLEGVSAKDVKRILITYEPIWAIGKSDKESVTPGQLHETILYLRKILSELYDRKTALSLPMLYGGSVEPGNAEQLLAGGDISGFLVGHASLEADSFARIVESAERT